jgi:hypothetical protein
MLTEVNNSAPSKKAIALPKRKSRMTLDCFIVVLDNQILISQIEEVALEDVSTGELAPEEIASKEVERLQYCRLVKPFVIVDDTNCILSPYLISYTNDDKFTINVNKLITLAKPNATLLAKYESLVLE